MTLYSNNTFITIEDIYKENSFDLEHAISFSAFELHSLISIFKNFTEGSNSTNLKPAADVSISGVLSSLVFNSIACVIFLGSYEILRRALPSVYASRRRHVSLNRMLSDLPSGFNPVAWVSAVFKIRWSKVRESGGLDSYMFLRYIQMCFRITAVAGFWGMVVLWPVFVTGNGGANGWYHFSMSNIEQGDWRIWIPTVFMWLFSGYVFYVMHKEYRHYLELRMDFLGKGDPDIPVQHHYSLIIERIPYELRSDKALFDYFESLFPGKVHSTCVVLNLPELESLAARRLRVTRRLEKAMAYLEATGNRPTHVVGRPRLMCCGIETELGCLSCRGCGKIYDGDDPPKRGDRVDSIVYYCRELNEMNDKVTRLQVKKSQIAETGNQSFRATNWLSRVLDAATNAAAAIGFEDNPTCGAFNCNSADENSNGEIVQYGSFENLNNDVPQTPAQDALVETSSPTKQVTISKEPHQIFTLMEDNHDLSWDGSDDSAQRKTALIGQDHLSSNRKNTVTFPGEEGNTMIGQVADKVGLDFLVDGCLFVNSHIDDYVDNVIGTTMSATGFVTFSDLASVTCAASAPLTHKPEVIRVKVAPEPRDIMWDNAHIDVKHSKRKISIANTFLGLGAILWSIPLAAIQAFATAQSLARIPGMSWILAYDSGHLASFINGYLPVVALLGLILLLPILFEWIAVHYENRKTQSEVQRAILTRYFYYQLANIYITVTAGSLWDSLADILDHPSSVLTILGKSLPTVVGYFISLLITKILAGLPMVLLRVGALSRQLFLRACFSEKKLTQRELDEVYRPHYLLYGWEYPTQLLVIMICFTYACISPMILPVGALYFGGALLIYKKQVLYVYTPAYESGGILFPSVCHRTLFGLVCAQLTLIGYITIRAGYYQPMVLLPLPFITFWMMRYFRVTYANTSKNLSLERAVDLDKRSYYSSLSASMSSVTNEIASGFSADAYRQPVLTAKVARPLPYRYGVTDSISEEVDVMLREPVGGRFHKMTKGKFQGA